MLSLRGVPPRQVRGGCVAGDVEELEEGEACPDDYDGGGGEAFFDPDVALSYIDEKLQHVLGHFQKDFEGGFTAENLGSKFGGYGSFLPTYQHSPSPLPQTRSPHMAPNISTSRSPYQPSAEIMDKNPSTSDLCKKERCSSTNSEDPAAGSDSLDSSFNGSDSKSLKVQIKVGSNNVPRKHAAIYSGLGLDISSSSSMEKSPDGLGGLSPEFSNVPYESPRTILQVMTCFPVPGGFLLSPLRDNVLQLTNKVAPLLKKWEIPFEGRSQSSLPPGHVRGHVAKQMKSGSKKKMSIDTKARKEKGGASVIVNKEVNIEMPAGQEVISDMPAPTTELGESQFARESTRNTCISGPSQQDEDFQLKEQIGGNDLATVKSEAIKEEAAKYTENSGLHNLGTGYLAPNGKQKIKTGGAQCLEERDMSNHKSCSFDKKKKSNVKAERKFEAPIVDFEGNEDKNKDSGVGPCDDLRNVPVKETFSSNRTGDDNSRTVVKRMHKEHQVNAAASYDFSEDDNCTHSSATIIDMKNDTPLKSSHFEKKAKSHKDVVENLPNRSQGYMEGFLLENRSAQGKLRQKERMMNTSDNNEFGVSSARKEIPTTVKPERFPVSEEQLHMPSTSEVATTNAATVPATVVIEDHWVCCDICQKWRLLPYGMDPSMLPKKWKCSMLYWLPGTNRCDISEDETTNALNASYVTPASATCVSSGGPHTAGAGTATSSAYEISGLLEQSRKRKNAPSDGNGLVESSYHTPLAIPPMSNQQDPSKNKRTVDGENNDFERDSVSKHGLRPMSKSADLVSEKQKSKHKNRSSHSDGGDLMERTKVHSKTKRGINQDEQKTSKKTRKEDWHQIDRDRDPDDSAGGEVPDEPNALPAKAKAMKGSHETGDISLRKEKVASGYDLLEKTKRTKEVEVLFHREKKEHPAGVERIDFSCKKTVKEREENKLNCVSSGSKNENLKEKKSNILKSEEMMSKVDSRRGKVQHADTLLSCTGGRLNHELVANNNIVTGKEGPSEVWENLPHRRALDLVEPTRRDVAYLQSSTSATSSSSKISSSRRNKNSQEAKDSPVESVSSSPLRNFNVEKLRDKKDGTVKAYSGTKPSPVKYSSTEVGVLNNDQQAENIEEVHASGKPNFHGSLLGSSDSNNKEVAQSAQAQVSAITHLERVSDNNLPKASWRRDLPENDTGVGTRDGHLSSTDKTGLDMEGPSLQPDQHLFDRRATALGTGSNSIAHENKTSALRHGCGSGQQLGISFGGKEKSQPRNDNQGIQKPVTHAVHLPMKESKQEVCPTSVKNDTSKMQAQLRRSSVKNGVQHGTVRQAISNSSDANPIRKDGSMVAFALKEARDLKHKANHLKNKGLELESTGLYFEAALKFLHVAFLLETPNFDSSRPGDAAQSMKMYSETAKLCKFCAHEYERCKKMAAAALAYKCVEVAYLKAAYYKHPSASKDRQELQAVVKIASGESPSSSASDIDFINSHGLSKTPSTKDESSPQVAGNHLPLAVRNQAHLLRLLAYINDVNCAFDATHKSQVAIASAAGSQERGKGVDDGFASVKTVLDFNFNNVNELLRLVRHSMESICI